jgi:hypothetical protein
MNNIEIALFGLLFLLSIVLITLGSIVHRNSKNSDEESQNNVQRSGLGILIIGVIFLLVCLGKLGMYFYNRPMNVLPKEGVNLSNFYYF